MQELCVDSSIARMYYIQLPTGGPTQGDIWSNLPFANGTNQLCNGLIITPRCDFAHSKSPVLNYLPIVSLEQYLRSAACFPHIEQVLSDTRESVRSKSGPLGVESLFELDIPLDEIGRAIELQRSDPGRPHSKQYEKARLDFEIGSKKIRELSLLLQKPTLTLNEIQSSFSKKRLLSIQRDLIRNNNVDTYFLPPCTGLIEPPSLVLLRHIYTCPIAAVDPSVRGGSLPPPERLIRLASPFIESLMSKFAALFTRVGTRDIPDPVVQTFILVEGTG
jgi:hypothetical protein